MIPDLVTTVILIIFSKKNHHRLSRFEMNARCSKLPQFYQTCRHAIGPGFISILETRTAFHAVSGGQNKSRDRGNK